MPNHETSGGLTISAGNADDAEVFGGMMVFGGSNDGLHPVIRDGGLIIEGERLKEFFELLFHSDHYTTI